MRILTFLLAFLSFSISFSQNYTRSSIPDELLINADAVVRLDKMDVVVEARDLMRVTSKRVVTVLNENGNRFVHASAYYDDGHKIGSLEAKIYDRNGEEVKKFRKKDFFDQSAVDGGTLYSDSRIMYMRYTPTDYPYTVEFTDSYVTSNTAFAPAWYFIDGYRVSTEQSEFNFTVTCGIPFRYKKSNLGSYAIDVEVSDTQLKSKGSHLKALKREPLAPAIQDLLPHVKLALEEFHLEGVDGTAKSWQDLGKWMYDKLLVGQGSLDSQTIQKVQGLVKDLDNPRDKVSKIYQYVQDNTRYISVQLGIGGWMPISATEVDRVKYGDCKGLTNYTMALLKAVGVESYYTVVHAGARKRDLDAEFPSMQGNHVILNIPLDDDDIWLECTSQVTPVDHLGTFTDNRNVLRVTPKGGELIRSKQYLDEDNHQGTKGEYVVHENGRVTGQVTIASTGIQYYQKFRNGLKSEVEKEEYYKDYWNYVNNLSLGKIEFNNDKQNTVFTEEIEIEADNYLSNMDGKLFLAPNLFNRNLIVPERSRSRKTDLVISRGYLDEDEFTIHLPEGYQLENPMEPIKLETTYGSYEISLAQQEPGILVYKRKLLVKSGQYTKEDYKPYRDFRKQVARFDNSRIILTKI